MKQINFLKIVTVLFIFILLPLIHGCSFKLIPNDEMIKSQVGSSPVLYTSAKKIILIIPENTFKQTVIKSPASFTGGGTSWEIPIGYYVAKSSIEYFSNLQGGPVTVLNEPPVVVESDTIILEPNIKDFKFWLNQLRNLGFAITPEAEATLVVKEYGSGESKLCEGEYYSGRLSGDSYAMATPGGVQNRVSRIIVNSIIKSLEQAGAKIPKRTAVTQN